MRPVITTFFTLIIMLIPAPLPGADWQPAPAPLMTPWSGTVDPGNVLPEYPRPQIRRTDWQNLNGLW